MVEPEKNGCLYLVLEMNMKPRMDIITTATRQRTAFLSLDVLMLLLPGGDFMINETFKAIKAHGHDHFGIRPYPLGCGFPPTSTSPGPSSHSTALLSLSTQSLRENEIELHGPVQRRYLTLCMSTTRDSDNDYLLFVLLLLQHL